MRVIIILTCAFMSLQATFDKALTKSCELAITQSIEVHLMYMSGDKTLTDSYNAEAKVKKICKD